MAPSLLERAGVRLSTLTNFYLVKEASCFFKKDRTSIKKNKFVINQIYYNYHI